MCLLSNLSDAFAQDPFTHCIKSPVHVTPSVIHAVFLALNIAKSLGQHTVKPC